MNPNLRKHELVFDSCFEGGNLDCAVRLKMNEYDLLMRVDSNSVGHIQWFYFRVANTEDAEKTIRFNLANLRKNKSAYERVYFRPYPRECGLMSRGTVESGSRRATTSRLLTSSSDTTSRT